MRLERLERTQAVVLWIDDPRGARDIPRAAEAEGYDVLAIEPHGERWRIVIQR